MNTDQSDSAGADNKSGRSVLRLLGRLALLGLALALLGAAGVVGIFAYHGRDLPSFEALADYHPPQVTRVFDRKGRLVAELFHERRTVVPKERIPALLKQAVISAEDSSFYQHKGLDYLGIARAVFKDVRHMRLAQGASTITQQVVKNMVLSPERSVARKVKEAILARRLEQNLSKEEILWLYLNHIYFGDNRYGIEEAARYLFDKPVDQLTLGEAALLAGIPQSPMKLSPLRHPDKAKARQTYVLRQMAENGFITQAQAEAEIARPLSVRANVLEPVGPYYVEEIRRRLIERYGEERVYEGGLRVDIAMDRELQAAADRSLRSGLEDVDRRFGYQPLAVKLGDGVLADLQKQRAAPAGAKQAWDFARVDAAAAASAEKAREALEDRPLAVGLELVAPVESVDEAAVVFDLGPVKGALPFERMKWARPYSPQKWTTQPKSPADVFAPGQLAKVRVVELPGAAKNPDGSEQPAQLELVPTPAVQGALVSIDPLTREVVALSGGYDFAASSFNRATQARRQPGSSFKPLVYCAALASGRFTTASLLNDAPDVYRDPDTGKEWKPQNFERDVFEGPMTLREALSKSKNTISVRLIEAVGPEAVVDLARKAGITSPLPENLTLALGTAEVSPLELANAYTTLATLGRRADPILIAKVTDLEGKVLEEHIAAPEETISPAVAYVAVSLMQSVVEMGTGMQARELRRPVAGKTGTASGNRDAWFSGFTPELVTTAWVGFDDHSPLYHTETGGRAALPIWLGYMKSALEGAPRRDFVAPPGVEQVRIDPQSGLRAPDGAAGRLEVFVEGTAPTEYGTRPGEADPSMLFLEDGGRER